jgi:hypothetical protein
MKHATEEEKELARKLYAEKPNYQWVGKVLGRSENTVAYWIDPERKSKQDQHKKNWYEANPEYTKNDEYKERNREAALNYYHRSKHRRSKASG